MMVSSFEDQLGHALFEHDGKTRLTPFGQYVYKLASEQLHRFDRVSESIRAYARNEIGRIDIASVPSFAIRYLPDLLTGFLARYPGVSLEIRDDSSEHINKLIEDGEIDVGIASPVEATGSINCQLLLRDPLGVVCASTHPLTELKRPLTWDDVAGQPFIANGTCRRISAQEFQPILKGAEINVENTTSLLALVAAGVGVTTLPRLAIPTASRDVVFLPTAYTDLQRPIGLLTPTERTMVPAANAFVEMVKAHFQDMCSDDTARENAVL